MIRKLFQWADKHIYLIKTVAVLWILMIIILCLMPSPDIPSNYEIPFLDKIVHFTFYFVLCLFMLLIFKIPKWSTRIFLLVILVFCFSLTIEIIQYIMPWERSFSVADLVANLSGIIAGIIIFPKNL